MAMVSSISDRKNFRLLISLLVAVTLTLTGFIVVYLQNVNSLHQSAQQRLSIAREEFDALLNHALKTAQAVAPLAGGECTKNTLQQLRREVATQPGVRTVNLAHGNSIYCTALYGRVSPVMDANRYVGGQLALMPGNQVTPDRSLIVYRYTVGNKRVLVGIDTFFIVKILGLLSHHRDMVFSVGDVRLSSDSEKIYLHRPEDNGPVFTLASQKFPYQLTIYSRPVNTLMLIWRNASAELMLFILMAVGAFGLVYVLTGRVNTPVATLKKALKNNEFIPYLQPVMNCDGTVLTGCEVLVRWQHPKKGIISPDHFIGLIEENGLNTHLTHYLFERVMADFAACLPDVPAGFHFGFNVTVDDLSDDRLVSDCEKFINYFRAANIKLVLEITERKILIKSNDMLARLEKLHNAGVLLAIDDFGTGYSSLSYFQEFKIDIIKIDRSFVSKIGTNAITSHLIDNIIELSEKLGLALVAEGVENKVQADYLRHYNVDYLQGYYLGRPLSVQDFQQTWLR